MRRAHILENNRNYIITPDYPLIARSGVLLKLSCRDLTLEIYVTACSPESINHTCIAHRTRTACCDVELPFGRAVVMLLAVLAPVTCIDTEEEEECFWASTHTQPIRRTVVVVCTSLANRELVSHAQTMTHRSRSAIMQRERWAKS